MARRRKSKLGLVILGGLGLLWLVAWMVATVWSFVAE